MATQLVIGQNLVVPSGTISVDLRTRTEALFIAFCLDADNQVSNEQDCVYYGNPTTDFGSVSCDSSANNAAFSIDLASISPQIQKIALTISAERAPLSTLELVQITAHGASSAFEATQELFTCELSTKDHKETALILGEFYRHNEQWKFRYIAQGFRDGLKALTAHFGLESFELRPRKQQPKPTPDTNLSRNEDRSKVSLKKVVLTKSRPKVDLKKHDTQEGIFRINLNWSQGDKSKRGLFRLFSRKKDVDLDLGAYVRFITGQSTVVQALGNRFGSLEEPPFIKLLGDDRTGAQADGEWIFVNGTYIPLIAEIVIFAFIYEGVPNWDATDAVVTIDIPGQPKIETHLTGGDNLRSMCAIARITSDFGDLSIERLNHYFTSHSQMDQAYGWGLNWRPGRK